ncbi:hypothetical protein QA601_06980 [Chitinispirillales bacterium ANBcel5]|uniref:hypothetical protein n=1 Tax=Cellulosispirillum alkaliphilum TaxID=3039283 RepID=UPI002A533649|nr:hypothetical protein [Chitinispirillales bacterium ANBcel5]
MRMVKPFPYVVLYAVFFSLVSIDANESEIRYAGEMMHLPVGSDVAAMGNSGVSLATRATSAYWNPAASSMLSEFEVSLEYANLFWGLAHHGVIALHMPLENAGIGLSALLIPFYSGTIQKWDTLSGTFQQRLHNPDLRADGSSDGHFYNTSTMMVVSLGRLFSIPLPRSAAGDLPLVMDVGSGVNFKGTWQTTNIDDKVRVGMNATLDLGVLMRFGVDYDFNYKKLSRFISLGVSLRNVIPSKMMWSHSDDGSGKREYKEPVHGTQHFGISYSDYSGFWGADWILTVSVIRNYAQTYHFGVEAEFWNTVSFRVGLSDKVPTLGTGVKFRNYFLDYAFRFDKLEYSPVRITMGFNF